MTSTPSDAPHPSPWLSLWLHPGATIERIVTTNPRRHVLLLAALAGMSNFIFSLIHFGSTIELLDWRIIAGIVVLGAIYGVVSLYISGLMFWLAGTMFGGRAASAAVRAAYAWGTAPSILALAIWLVALAAFKLLAGAAPPPSATQGLNIALQAVGGLLGLWAAVMIFLMLKRVQGFGIWRALASSALGLVLVSLITALLIRTFLFQPFSIFSGSQKPTLFAGDYLFVSKYSYGYSHYSLPLSPPLFSGRIFGSEPERGDMVVFRLPRDDSVDYIFRVIGLPGDRIQMINGHLHINGEPVKRERIEDFVETEGGRTARIKRWRETLPNGVSFTTLDLVENGFYDNTPVYEVPAGRFFVLGDNRDNASDSRVMSQTGYIPFENLVGRVQIIFFSIDRDSRELRVRHERIGTWVR